MSATATPTFWGDAPAPRHVHQPAHRLSHEVVARPVRVASALPEAADGAIHQPGIEPRQAGVVETEFLQASHLEVLDQHIRRARELHRPGAVRLIAKIQHERFLAPVAGMEVGRIRLRAVGVRQKRRSPAAGLVTRGRFDLDDLRAEIGQDLADPGAGQHARQLQHAKAAIRRVCSLGLHCSHLPTIMAHRPRVR